MPLGRANQVHGNTPSKKRQALHMKEERLRNEKDLAKKRRTLRNWMPIDSRKRCAAAISVYGVKGSNKNAWMCDWNYQSQLKFREKNYAVQLSDVRVFIEGAEVSAYLRGAITWSIQSTGGMNTCSFTLNNNQDAFIITPTNVCANVDPRGWRLPYTTAGKLITSAFRQSYATDELAKFIIYKNKWNAVDPLGSNPKIDPHTGEWLYPLHPYRSIFHKHDCVRVFYRLPHISGMSRVVDKKVIESRETWAPAFTGFIDENDMEDNPAEGDRVINIRCYDYRGLLARMRVRTSAFRTTTQTSKDKVKANVIFGDKNKAAKKGKKTGKSGINTDFLNKITDLGISAQLIELFTLAFEAGATQCKKSGAATTKCQKEVYDDLLKRVKNDVDELSVLFNGGRVTKGDNAEAFLGLDPARKAANKADGRSREFARNNLGPVTITTKKQGSENIGAIVNKVRSFLNKSGETAVAYIANYARAYDAVHARVVLKAGQAHPVYHALYQAWRKPTKLSDVDTARFGTLTGAQMQTVNTQSEIATLDTKLEQDYPQIYKGARFATSSGKQTKRMYTLSKYIREAVTGPFAQVSSKVKAEIDDYMMNLGANVPLFVGRRRKAKDSTVFTITAQPITFSQQAELATVVKALELYAQSKLVKKQRAAAGKIPGLLNTFNSKLNDVVAKLKKAYEDAAKAIANDPDVRTRAKVHDLRKRYDALHSKGQDNRVKKLESTGSVATLIQTDAKFTTQLAGMYADLVKVSKRDSHPLAGMSFEMATLWLTLTHTPLSMGFEDKLDYYDTTVKQSKVRQGQQPLDRGSLENHNLNMVFGIMGRPLTYAEVTEMGKGTISEVGCKNAPFSPLNAFVHLLLPKAGTGATSIMQQDISNPAVTHSSYAYSTRLELLNKISEMLDYQFYVTPIGDLAFEFPHYNALPTDFGIIFSGAYTVMKGLRSFKATAETGDINTAWVLTGKENEKILDDVTKDVIIENKLKKTVIIADMLARRVGVKVRHLQLEIPGVGAVFAGGAKGVQMGQPLSSLIAYGLLEIQRELGRMETISVTHEFRPYLLPNRPVHIVHRQRMALIKSVTYSMAVPNGECMTQSDLHYVRGLCRDGSFNHTSTGGQRMAVDYSGLFTGASSSRQKLKFGSGNIGGSARGSRLSAQSLAQRDAVLANTGVRGRDPSRFTNLSCGPYLKDRWIESASACSDQIDSTFRLASNFQSESSGAQGFAGALSSPPSRGSTLGARSFRKAPSGGDRAAAVQTRGSGISIATDQGKEKTDTKRDDYLSHFNNPWPFSLLDRKAGESNIFSQWGFTRKVTAEGSALANDDAISTAKKRYLLRNARPHKGKVGGWHTGVDFNNLKKPTPAYAPIELRDVRAVLYTGWKSNAKGTSGYRLVPVPADGKVPADIVNFLMRHTKDKSPYFQEISTGTTYRNAANEFVAVTQKYFMVNTRIEETYKRIITEANEGATGNRKVQIPIRPSGAPTGLFVYGYGVAVSPKTSLEVACRLTYAHCHKLVKDSTGKYYLGSENTPMQYRTAPADTVITYAGNTGTSNIHLHFGMDIYPPGHEPGAARGSTSQDAYKAVMKANAEFLRTQIQMKLTAGKGRGLNSGKLSPAWQRYFATVNKKGGNITTVDQATEYLINKSKNFREATALVGKRNHRIPTNPLFFFRPEQIIKSMDRAYAKHNRKYGHRVFVASSGTSICGANSAVAQQKISLEYSTCMGKARRLSKPRDRRDALKGCKAARKGEQLALKGNIKPRQGANQARVERKIDARSKARNARGRGSARQQGAA